MKKNVQRNENNWRSGSVTRLRVADPYAFNALERNCLGIKLAFFGKLLHRRGYVAGTNGNLSVRLGPDNVLMTPSGVSKGFLRTSDMVVVTLDGKKIAGSYKPSSEIGMHLRIYKLRPDITAVVHAHPCIATGFASAPIGLMKGACPELALTLGDVPLAPYALPGTDELATALEPFIPGHSAILMQNHGVVTYGETLERAYLNMETVEHCAKIMLAAKMCAQQLELQNDSNHM
jgi:L-fuculose-phosphate aldolase